MTRNRTRLAAAGFLTSASLLLSACGSDDPESPSTPDDGPASENTITIADFAYGDPLTVAPGTEVTVVNEDSAPHNANDADGAFEEPLLQQGESATFTAPEEAGTYDLICTQHSQMSGELIVEG